MTSAPDLPAIIARLRRAQPRNPDTMALCDAAEALRLTAAQQASALDKQRQSGKRLLEEFDRLSYQRAYMRDARAAKKLGITTAAYRKRDR